MKKGIYVIYDKLAKRPGPVFEAVNVDVAKRLYNNTMENVSESCRKDYELLHLGYIKYEDDNVQLLLPDFYEDDLKMSKVIEVEGNE